jgi:hypothetical protein
MDVKNLLGKLHAQEPVVEQAASPRVPVPPVPKAPAQAVHAQITHGPVIEERIIQAVQPASGGRRMTREEFDDGIILDLGEGISLNIPIQRRMSLTDFIKLAEKVKALEMLSESSEMIRKGQY